MDGLVAVRGCRGKNFVRRALLKLGMPVAREVVLRGLRAIETQRFSGLG